MPEHPNAKRALVGGRLPRWAVALIVAGLLGVQWGLIVTSVQTKCATSDEVFHLTGGYSYWRYGDFRLQPENGVLPQRWAALPLLGQDLRFPSTESDDWRRSEVWSLSRTFVYLSGNDANAMLRRGRLMISVLPPLLGLLVFFWSRYLFGSLGGVISVAVYTFCPSILAHGGLATSDMMVTLMFPLALGAVWRSLHKVSALSVAAGGLTLGLLAVAKMSAVVMAPVVAVLLAVRVAEGRPLLVVVRGRRRTVRARSRQAAVLVAALAAQAVAAVLVIWLFYNGRYQAVPTPGTPFECFQGANTLDSLSATQGATGAAVRWARDHRLLPEAYLHGFSFVLKHATGRTCFLNGEFSTTGFRAFFPYCFAAKTPLWTIAILMLALLSLRGALGQRCSTAPHGPWPPDSWRRLYHALPLWLFLVVFAAFAVCSHLNIGHRHLLPVYPVLYVLAGATAYWFAAGGRRRLAQAVLVLLLGLAVESVCFWPHYLAYFNALAGGPRHAYRHLVDSSLDWGQDLPGLRAWIERERQLRPGTPVFVSYFATASLAYERIDAVRLPCFGSQGPIDLRPLTGGAYCASATMLQGVYSSSPGPWTSVHEDAYRWLATVAEPLWNRAVATGTRPTLSAEEERAVSTRVRDLPGHQDKVEILFQMFEELRFGRLRNYLLAREPDDTVGYSILIYRLSDADVEAALHGDCSAWQGPVPD